MDRTANTQTQAAPSELFVGRVGQRLELKLRLDEVRGGKSTDGDFYRIYKFTDEQGRRFSWISSSGPNSWHEGRVLEVKATVKKHTCFRWPETELTRVKITAVVEPEATTQQLQLPPEITIADKAQSHQPQPHPITL